MKTILAESAQKPVRHGPSILRVVTGALLRHGVLIGASFRRASTLCCGWWRHRSSPNRSSSRIYRHSAVVRFLQLHAGLDFLAGSFTVFFKNSFLVAILVVIGNVLSCSITAYAFARLEFRGRRFWFVVMLGTLMLPITSPDSPIRAVPEPGLDRYFPAHDRAEVLAADAFFIFLMVQFFRGIPRGRSDEAAVLDGCGPWRIYWKIMMPLSLPVLTTTAIFSFIWTWNDFLGPLVHA